MMIRVISLTTSLQMKQLYSSCRQINIQGVPQCRHVSPTGS
jgi:hypothetical protein